jgi:hypothetical protein
MTTQQAQQNPMSPKYWTPIEQEVDRLVEQAFRFAPETFDEFIGFLWPHLSVQISYGFDVQELREDMLDLWVEHCSGGV